MTSRRARRRAAAAAITLSTVLTAVCTAVPAVAASGDELAPGVEYRTFTVATSHGPAVAYLLTVDLRRARLDLLRPAEVAERAGVSAMAGAQHALAGVNGDFFNITDEHPGIVPTGSSVGPEIASGHDLKFAVPDGQRFGPAMPAGATTKIVFGEGADGRARVGSVALAGSVSTPRGEFGLEGLNQYALPVGGIGEYTPAWGEVSRARAVCGTDTARGAACSTDAEEVVVRRGVVVSEAGTPGAGQLPADSVALVGREKGADELRELKPGDHVEVGEHIVAGDAPQYRFAVGGFPILSDGKPLPDLDAVTLAPRTAAGASPDGRTAYLFAVDGRSAASSGMSVLEVADLLREQGATSAVNLDGGGSTTIATAQDGVVADRNVPSDGTERAVANGVGVFSPAR